MIKRKRHFDVASFVGERKPRKSEKKQLRAIPPRVSAFFFFLLIAILSICIAVWGCYFAFVLDLNGDIFLTVIIFYLTTAV